MSRTFNINIDTAFGPLQHEVVLPDAPISLAEFVLQLYALEEEWVRLAANLAIADGVTQIKCRPKCGACCRQAVPISIPETFLLNDLVESLPDQRKAEILERFEAIQRNLKAHSIEASLRSGESSDQRWARLGLRYFALQMPCPFLEEESCSIYEKRPTICREFLVTSPPSACSEPDLENVRGIDNVFILSHSLARLAGILMDQEPHLIPLTLSLYCAESHASWAQQKFDPYLLYSTLFDLIKESLTLN